MSNWDRVRNADASSAVLLAPLNIQLVPDVRRSPPPQEEVYRPHNFKRRLIQKSNFLMKRVAYLIFRGVWDEALLTGGRIANFPIVVPSSLVAIPDNYTIYIDMQSLSVSEDAATDQYRVSFDVLALDYALDPVPVFWRIFLSCVRNDVALVHKYGAATNAWNANDTSLLP